MSIETATDLYIQNQRATEGPDIAQGLADAGGIKVVATGGNKPIKDVTTEVNCCLKTCLLEAIYGIESTYGQNNQANMIAFCCQRQHCVLGKETGKRRDPGQRQQGDGHTNCGEGAALIQACKLLQR